MLVAILCLLFGVAMTRSSDSCEKALGWMFIIAGVFVAVVYLTG